jgi:serine/threonine-protein kinase RsbW
VVVEKRFEAQIAVIPETTAFVAGHAAAWGLHPQRLRQLELAVEEAVANICDYAYEVPPGDFTVRIRPEASRLVVEIVDEGVPFDPLDVAEPDLRAGVADRPIGGLGILLVRRLMDEVSYRRDGTHNILTLIIKRT